MPKRIDEFTDRSKWNRLFDTCTPNERWQLEEGEDWDRELCIDTVRLAARRYAISKGFQLEYRMVSSSVIQIRFCTDNAPVAQLNCTSEN